MRMSKQFSIVCGIALSAQMISATTSAHEGNHDDVIKQQSHAFSTNGSAFYVTSGDRASEMSIFRYTESARASRSTDSSEYSSVRFGINQDTNLAPMQFSGAIGDGEYQSTVSGNLGDLSVSFSGGAGHSYSKLDHDNQGMNPNFFHGGAAVDFRYNAMQADYALSDKADAGFGYAKVEALGLEDRNAFFAGISTDRFYNRFTTFERGDDTAGYGVDMGFSQGRYNVDFQGLSTRQDASMARLNLSVSGNNQDTFGVYLESAKNPLYTFGEDTRVMFSYGGVWQNRSGVFNASHEDMAKNKRENRRYGKAALAVAAAAILVSSGGDSKDKTKRFPNQNAAAFDATNAINPKSVLENREYAGMVFRNGDGTYGATGPRAGKLASIFPGDPSTVPVGTRATAYYHTHSQEDDRFASERFSGADIRFAERFRIDGYVGTPFGKFLRYNYITDKVTRVGTVATPTTL